MESALNTLKFTLPVGVVISGQHLQDFELGPVLGKLRRDILNAPSQVQQVVVALSHVVKRIGPLLPGAAPQIIKQLTLPDVDYLHMLVTFREAGGALLTWEYACGEGDNDADGCHHKDSVNVNLEKVALLPGSGNLQFNKRGLPYQEVTFEDPETKRSIPVKFRVATLQDQERFFEQLATKAKSNAKDRTQNTGLGTFLFHQMSMLMDDYDDKGRGLTPEEMDELPVRTVDALLAASKKHSPPQIDSEVAYTCIKCGREQSLVLPVQRWLDPFATLPPSQS